VDVLGMLLGGMLLASVGGAAVVESRRTTRLVIPGIAAMLALACVWFLVADVRYASGLRAFESGDMVASLDAHTAAVAGNPLVDNYRVAHADAAMYSGRSAVQDSLGVVEAGLDLEPASYDLLLARARLLGMLDSSPRVLAAAYEDAAASYPLGVAVRREAIGVLIKAGMRPEALAMARDVLAVVPDDTTAVRVIGELEQ